MKPWRIHSSSASSLSVWKTPPTTSSRARCEFDGPYYEEEIEEMKATASTTMFIDFSHVMRYNDFLHQTISDEYLEFEPYLRSACRDFGWNICMLKRADAVGGDLAAAGARGEVHLSDMRQLLPLHQPLFPLLRGRLRHLRTCSAPRIHVGK